jgi:hypothetical protein
LRDVVVIPSALLLVCDGVNRFASRSNRIPVYRAESESILSANLKKLDEWTLALITNRDVLNVNQNSHNRRQVVREGDAVAWIADGAEDTRYLALFNLNDRDKTIDRTYDFYNLPAKTYRGRELWSHRELGLADGVKVTLPALVAFCWNSRAYIQGAICIAYVFIMVALLVAGDNVRRGKYSRTARRPI